MTGGEREAALWAAARHYAHLAHHGPSDGGVSQYSRAEAQLVLMSMITVIDGAIIALSDGLPTSASGPL
jgi:hypothetical protein